MANVFSKALFRTPKYNVFPQENEVKLSYEIGKLIPVQYWDLVPGDSIKTKLSQLTRFAPMLAPIFQRFKIDFHAIAVPHRLAIPMPVGTYDGYFDGFESFHNLAVSDANRPIMPQMTIGEYGQWLSAEGINPIGTLFDYLGYPTFESIYRKFLADFGKVLDLSTSKILYDEGEDTYYIPGYEIYSDGLYENDFYPDIFYVLNAVSIGYYTVGVTRYSFNNPDWKAIKNYLIAKAQADADSTTWPLPIDERGIFTSEGTVNIDAMNSALQKLGNVDTFIANYSRALYSIYLSVNIPLATLSSQPLSLLPLYAYWSAVYDWYINTNLEPNSEKKDTWIHEQIGLPFVPYTWTIGGVSSQSWIRSVDTSTLESTYLPSTVWTPQDRYWSNDYFTSAFLSAQAGNPVGLAGVSTIADLRNANSLQQFMEKLIYSGKRAIDVIKTIFGVKSSDERLDRCQVIGSKSFVVNFADVLQTSQSDINSQLGQFAGQGISVGKDSFIDFQAEEHTLVMVFMSLRPNAIYESQLNHLLLQVDPYDFLIPDFANIGEQAILECELDPTQGDDVFGWTRRYAQYMFTPSHIHGEFKTSLDYWHDARRFDNTPTLNTEFCKVTAKDDLNRIFTVPTASEHIYSYLHFDTAISRPLGKFVQYSL